MRQRVGALAATCSRPLGIAFARRPPGIAHALFTLLHMVCNPFYTFGTTMRILGTPILYLLNAFVTPMQPRAFPGEWSIVLIMEHSPEN